MPRPPSVARWSAVWSATTPVRATVVDQTRCEQVGERVSEQRRIAGYTVEYRYHGDVYVSRLNYDPGDRLRIRISINPAE